MASSFETLFTDKLWPAGISLPPQPAPRPSSLPASVPRDPPHAPLPPFDRALPCGAIPPSLPPVLDPPACAHDPGALLTLGRADWELSRRIIPAGHSGMGQSPSAAKGEYGIRLFRVPRLRPKPISRTTTTGSSDTQCTTGLSTLLHSGLPLEWVLSLDALGSSGTSEL